jgi:mannose-1-phosphate guanylyltransferase
MKAMILAAGFGTRLRPYSNNLPKPLFPLLGNTLLSCNLAQLRRAGCLSIIINCHYLKHLIIKAFADVPDVILQPESEILGTGGGLRMAVSCFDDQPVLVVNSDIFHTIDLGKVYDNHLESGAEITMVMHDYPRFNNVIVSSDGMVKGFDGPSGDDCSRLAFTGIHVISPRILSLIPENTFYNIIDCYKEIINSGAGIRAEIINNHFWTDMGTPADYLRLHSELLLGNLDDLQQLWKHSRMGSFYIHETAVLDEEVHMNDWVSIGANTQIGKGVSLSRVIVWDNCVIPAGQHFSDTIIHNTRS